ncbi:hypothetical protein MBRU_16220 [Mycolicibacterium brumae DSM 44177]|nr:hypothetical protein MBRU_16220 [Mycolicibacterium brumae DSM 44177]
MGIQESSEPALFERLAFIRNVEGICGERYLGAARSPLQRVRGVLDQLLDLLAAISPLSDAALLAGVLLNTVEVFFVDAHAPIAMVIDESLKCGICIGPSPDHH